MEIVFKLYPKFNNDNDTYRTRYRAIELVYYKPHATYEDHLESVNLFLKRIVTQMGRMGYDCTFDASKDYFHSELTNDIIQKSPI